MTGNDAQVLKRRVIEEVERRATQLVDVARQIHAKPELGHEEYFAHALLAEGLEAAGLEVERSAFGLATAFAARAGSDGPVVAVLCEYDALPDLGHACGHNVIAAAGLGAGIAASIVAQAAGGRLLVLGTPSEETAPPGKLLLAERGAFAGVEAAMMVHPAGKDLRTMDALAVVVYQVDYFGHAAHAASAPERGRNALDAAVFGYNAVAALRQHILPSERIHGIFTNAGTRPNLVPDHTTARWAVRSATLALLGPLEIRFLACLQAGADAAGCRMEATELARGEDLRTNPVLIDCYVRNMGLLGRPVHDPAVAGGVVGSTDMGKISYLVPSIHPMIKIAPADVAIHDPVFADHACSTEAAEAVIDGAKAMAMTIVDLWTDPTVLPALRTAFAAEG